MARNRKAFGVIVLTVILSMLLTSTALAVKPVSIKTPSEGEEVSGVYNITPEDHNGLGTDSMVMVQISGGQWKKLD